MKINLIILAFAVLFTSCDNKYEAKDPDDLETINSGKLTVYCDELTKPILDSAFNLYTKEYQKVELTTVYANSRNVMSQLLSKEARVIVNARDYLTDEDSLMKVYNIENHKRFIIAYDALVYFTNKNFPVDTLNANQIANSILLGKELNSTTAGLNFEPSYATLDQYSSVYANFNSMIVKDNPLKRKVELFDNIDALKKHVAANNSIIGICFLSQIINEENFKMIRLGFDSDSLNQYITPKPVHQGYIVQDLYPYKVPYYTYLLEDRQNLPFWFGTFLAKQESVQRLFLDKGIVPAFARIKLKYEE
ncbi:MAG: hypothetical protein R2863_02385 [Candidatus Kapaibacterium sp.]|nr:substrate-binding domain-containing protein [Ignavibacteriota bacterium]MCB9220805.1 substrate-binding domain-containing protein [Ignavibacteria bacterium]